MKRNKIFALLICLLLMLPMLFAPVSAEETINDLTKVYNNLSSYLYKPYFEDSQYYEEYNDMMEDLGALLKTDSITQAEIVTYYNGLREVYSKMMQDTFDYSQLTPLVESFEVLPEDLFTAESWKKLLSTRDSIQSELEAPTLFYRKSNASKEQYTKDIDECIASLAEDFRNAFADLEMIEAPEVITKAYLADYTDFIRFCAREELLGETEAWDDLQKAIADADTACALNNPRQARLTDSFEGMNTHFAKACAQGYDFTKAKETLTQHSIMVGSHFSKASWDRYDAEIHLLREALEKPHYFLIPVNADKDTCTAFAKDYLDKLSDKALSAHGMLVPMEDYNLLLSLCQSNKSRTTMEGLDIKLNLLHTRVKEGENALADQNATKDTIAKAIENIQTASEDLVMAEGHLRAEQEKVVKQDTKTSRYTLIFTVTSVALAVFFAIVLSKRYFGKVNWRR